MTRLVYVGGAGKIKTKGEILDRIGGLDGAETQPLKRPRRLPWNDMADAKDVLEQQFLEMRWRTLSLAADLDRIGRAAGGTEALARDPRVMKLRQAFELLLSERGDRAAGVQMIFSDMTPPPK